MDHLENSFRLPPHTIWKVSQVDEYAGILGKVFSHPPHSIRKKLVDIVRRKLLVVDATAD